MLVKHLQIKAHVLTTSIPIEKHFLFFVVVVVSDAVSLSALTYIYAELKLTKLLFC